MNLLRSASVGICFGGGFLGVIFGFGTIPFCDIILPVETICIYFVIYGAVSVFAIIGALLELKKLLIGSIVSLISGVSGLVSMAILYVIPSFYYPSPYFFSFLLVIGGGVLGIWEFVRIRERGN